VLQGLLPYVNSFIVTGDIDVNINLLSKSCDIENYMNLLSNSNMFVNPPVLQRPLLL